MNLIPEDAFGLAEVEVTRGALTESVHSVAVVVARADGRRVAAAGDPTQAVFYRSAAKPIQALPLVEDGVVDRFGLTAEELALCCGSHNAERRHVELARSILAKADVEPEALACGPHPPMLAEEAAEMLARGARPERVHNNCSGKHAGMLALAVAHGWPTEGYHLAAHPVQHRMLDEVARWTGLAQSRIGTAVDGCGVVCFSVPLEAMALSFARFAEAADRGEAAAQVVSAMTAHPFSVGGSGRLCTALMERTGDRIFVKTGAEGVYCAGLPERGLGVALKALDGGKRAAEVALLKVLADIEALPREDLNALASFARPAVRNTRGEVVGEVRASFELEVVDGRPGGFEVNATEPGIPSAPRGSA
jgi:L-asparaginase II